MLLAKYKGECNVQVWIRGAQSDDALGLGQTERAGTVWTGYFIKQEAINCISKNIHSVRAIDCSTHHQLLVHEDLALFEEKDL